MKNKILSERTAHDIDKQVAKILHDLGNPRPPLQLEDVRRLLRLDLHYYSSTDDGVLREVVHKLIVAGKQVINRPALLAEAIRKFDLKALFLPDRKRILIDRSQPEKKWRWNETHEIVHSIIPWHGSLMLGDTNLTLTPSCHEQTEAETNYGAGRLLFMQDAFDEMARDTAPNMKALQGLYKIFGNTLTSTLWRYVEQSDKTLLGLVTVHPHRLPEGFNREDPCKHFIQSKPFASQFPDVTEMELFVIISSYCSRKKGGPLGIGEAILQDVNGAQHIFRFETFCNSYEALTLGVYCGMRALAVPA